MSGTLSRADLVESLKAMLMSSADKFATEGRPAFERHLAVAAEDLARVRPLRRASSVTLVADQYAYPLSLPDVRGIGWPMWGDAERRARKPWDSNYPTALPSVSLIDGQLWLLPAPTAAQIIDLGATYRFVYFAHYTIGDSAAQATVPPALRETLLVRAVAAALFELANRGFTQPVQLGDGVGSMPRNGTPASLAEAALKLFERMAGHGEV